jgi:hypothetical protein
MRYAHAAVAAVILSALFSMQMQTAIARPAGRYARALQMEARRDAFWRHRPTVRQASAKFWVSPDTLNRKQGYWDSQQRSRADNVDNSAP